VGGTGNCQTIRCQLLGVDGCRKPTAIAVTLPKQPGRPILGWFYKADRRNPASFYDVTQGDNQLKLVTCCSATTGYDDASGLGVPDWSVLPGDLPAPAR
jgi:hypothetical protein